MYDLETMKENNPVESQKIEQGRGYESADWQSFKSEVAAKTNEMVESFYTPKSPTDNNVVFVSTSGEAKGEWPNLKITNKIYAYNVQTGELSKLYEEHENRLLRTMGIEGSKLILMYDGTDNSPGPCFSIWADWNDFGYLDVENPGTLNPYTIPEYQVQKGKEEQVACQKEMGFITDEEAADHGIMTQIEGLLAIGNGLIPTENPNFSLPSDIHEAQVDGYSKLGDIYMALVRRPSMNVQIEGLPTEFNADFSGIIAANPSKGAWEKVVTISDVDPTDKNNPYALWTNQHYLFMTVVDQHGAGSGEGIMKVVASNDAKEWTKEACYYFGTNYNEPKESGNYFKYSMTGLSEGGQGLQKHSGKDCDNIQLDNLK
ncbi:hypothetical protein IPJ72_02415 [Candidatus Peregrinibacteria bacterium]|nr:MAG: hypothetical protein IPJ72_02415 [Candidatus Peregrinibacteria bacterium]